MGKYCKRKKKTTLESNKIRKLEKRKLEQDLLILKLASERFGMKQILVTQDPDSRWFKIVAQDFKVYDITVHKGFKTNLASIPRFLFAFFPPQDNQLMVPSIVHDYVYAESHMNEYSRKDCDRLFRKLLLEYGVSKWKAELFYKIVRWFGKAHYKKRKPLISVDDDYGWMSDPNE